MNLILLFIPGFRSSLISLSNVLTGFSAEVHLLGFLAKYLMAFNVIL